MRTNQRLRLFILLGLPDALALVFIIACAVALYARRDPLEELFVYSGLHQFVISLWFTGLALSGLCRTMLIAMVMSQEHPRLNKAVIIFSYVSGLVFIACLVVWESYGEYIVGLPK